MQTSCKFIVSLAGILVLAFCYLVIWVSAWAAGQRKELTAPDLSLQSGWAVCRELLS